MNYPDSEQAPGAWIESGPLSIRIERDPPELYVIELYGEFDLASAEAVSTELQRAAESDVEEILVDLSGLQFIDSTGLGVLCAAHGREHVGLDRMRFLRGEGSVARVFELTGLDRTLPFADRAEAPTEPGAALT